MHISDWSSDVCSSDLTVDSYKYYVVPDSAYGTPFARYAAIAPHISSGVCKPTGVRKQACAAHRDYGWPWPDNKYCDDYYAKEYECTADLPVALSVSPLTGASWNEKGSTSTVVTRRADSCGSLAGDEDRKSTRVTSSNLCEYRIRYSAY